MASYNNGQGWSIRHGGGRTADIHWRGDAVDCVQVCDYDWEKGECTSPEPNRAQLCDILDEWLADNRSCLSDYKMSVA